VLSAVDPVSIDGSASPIKESELKSKIMTEINSIMGKLKDNTSKLADSKQEGNIELHKGENPIENKFEEDIQENKTEIGDNKAINKD